MKTAMQTTPDSVPPPLARLQHPNLVIDLVYGTPRNLTGKVLYPDPQPLLHHDAALCLYRAADLAQAQGLKLHLWDTFRPTWVQERLWQFLPDPNFVADPAVGSDHSRGIAVDLTLEDAHGALLDMGTDFDAAVIQSYHGNTDVSAAAQGNRLLLLGLMHLAGFAFNPHEWWHYALPNAGQYQVLRFW